MFEDYRSLADPMTHYGGATVYDARFLRAAGDPDGFCEQMLRRAVHRQFNYHRPYLPDLLFLNQAAHDEVVRRWIPPVLQTSAQLLDDDHLVPVRVPVYDGTERLHRYNNGFGVMTVEIADLPADLVILAASQVTHHLDARCHVVLINVHVETVACVSR